MKKAILSFLFFAAIFAAQGQRSLNPQPSPKTVVAPNDSLLKVYFWVEGKGVKSLTCNVIRFYSGTAELISFGENNSTATFYVATPSIAGITPTVKVKKY